MFAGNYGAGKVGLFIADFARALLGVCGGGEEANKRHYQEKNLFQLEELTDDLRLLIAQIPHALVPYYSA